MQDTHTLTAFSVCVFELSWLLKSDPQSSCEVVSIWTCITICSLRMCLSLHATQDNKGLFVAVWQFLGFFDDELLKHPYFLDESSLCRSGIFNLQS